jgi:hypothetical protein
MSTLSLPGTFAPPEYSVSTLNRLAGIPPHSRAPFPLHSKTPQSIKVPGIGRDIEVKIASERAEWEQAFRLVADNYRARGYEAADSGGVRFTPYHALPDTATFVAKHDGEVIATLSLVPDNFLLGLPMQDVYNAEIEGLRREGRRLVEVTTFADRDLPLREFVPVFVALLRVMVQWGISEGADTWVISVIPRHSTFYRRMLGFASLGPPRAHPCVRGVTGEACMLDVPMLKANAPKMYQEIFGEQLPPEVLTARRMPVHLLRYFGSVSSQTDGQAIAEILSFVECFGSPRQWR